jgi:hypothetical protein
MNAVSAVEAERQSWVGNGTFAGPLATTRKRRAQLFVTHGLVMHWPSVLASGNPLGKGQRFVRPSRKDAGRNLCGRCNGVF